MVIKYDCNVSKDSIKNNITRLTNQIYKVLPLKEEKRDWKTSLNNTIFELVGLDSLLSDNFSFFKILCKLESLLFLDNEDDEQEFFYFRRTIFECLSLMNEVKKCLDSIPCQQESTI